jgi:hypothetical protein
MHRNTTAIGTIQKSTVVNTSTPRANQHRKHVQTRFNLRLEK